MRVIRCEECQNGKNGVCSKYGKENKDALIDCLQTQFKNYTPIQKPRYKCIKGMLLEKYDADGFLMEGRYCTIPEGSIWELETESPNLISGPDCVHLDRVWKTKKAKTQPYIELTKEHLAEYFELIESKEG